MYYIAIYLKICIFKNICDCLVSPAANIIFKWAEIYIFYSAIISKYVFNWKFHMSMNNHTAVIKITKLQLYKKIMKPNEVPNVSLRVIQYFDVENYINCFYL